MTVLAPGESKSPREHSMRATVAALPSQHIWAAPLLWLMLDGYDSDAADTVRRLEFAGSFVVGIVLNRPSPPLQPPHIGSDAGVTRLVGG